ncbi:MAG: choice-of-anchor B family protein [Armatimonadetes bacterium]|nr:choice-of-anchor B family protein [Armatimonadota bacterium]
MNRFIIVPLCLAFAIFWFESTTATDFDPTAGDQRRSSDKSGNQGESISGFMFDSFNVALFAQISLAAFAANSGNDCWGYVSPSGREYALMGLNNKVAFVEVTNPVAPNWFASIGHGSSSWCDIKVYRDHCYIVTEGTASGIQVVDLSQIDSGVVRLVRTIVPGEHTHNIALDTDSGFLYTCISSHGSGTTECFDLTNPSNPVQVGAASLTGSDRMHDSQIVTFFSGPYAGRQILYGASEGRGVIIWDVTNKNAPFRVSRTTYSNVAYTHQCWLSADRNLLYVDDELDNIPRTLVFDVSDINSPVLVNTFTSGQPSIDHNLYLKGGFIFESNYTSGLRIFDANDDPVNPVETGWFDTYPENNNPSFSGSWSNFPFFPSGTIIVSDMNRGLFVLDASAATLRNAPVSSFNVVRGVLKSGNLASLDEIDGDFLMIAAGPTVNPSESPINVEFTGAAPWDHASKLAFSVTGLGDTVGLAYKLFAFDWDAASYVLVGTGTVTTSLVTIETVLPDADRFIQSGTKFMKAKMEVMQVGPASHFPWQFSFDQVVWKINP